MTINLPKDYQVPEGTKDGETFKEIATFRVSKGKLTLLSIGDDEVAISRDKKPKGAKQAISEELQNATPEPSDEDADNED